MNPLPRLSLAVCALAALALPGSALAGGTPAGHVLTLTVVGSPPAAVSVDSITVEAGSLTFGLWGYRNSTKTFIAMGEDFRGWRGACTGITETCTVTFSTDLILNAYFGQDPPPDEQPVVVPPAQGGSGASAGSGSSPAGGSAGPGSPAATPAPRGTPRLPRTSTAVRGGVVRTSGRLPVGARTVTQAIVLRSATGVSARGACTVNRRARTYRCTATLAPGTWVVTTRAAAGRSVLAQSTATVRVRSGR